MSVCITNTEIRVYIHYVGKALGDPSEDPREDTSLVKMSPSKLSLLPRIP